MKKRYEYQALVKQGFLLIAKSLDSGMTNKAFRDECRRLINSYAGLVRSERLDILDAMLSVYRAARHYVTNGKWKDLLARKSRYDTITSACRRAAASRDIRAKFDSFYQALENGYIFFLCTEHYNCAKDHKPYQGKLYIDAGWRLHCNENQVADILGYIQNRKIMTVQKVTGKPIWLCTRPYCRHKLIPVDTPTVLGSSFAILKRKYLKMTREVYTPYNYDEFRKEVYTMLNKAIPCKEFARIANKK